MSTLTEQLKHVGEVVVERGAVYGHPADDFRRAALIGDVLMDCRDPMLRHVLYMIGVKMCRLVQTPYHEDSWLDIVGYVHTAALVMERRNEGARDDREK